MEKRFVSKPVTMNAGSERIQLGPSVTPGGQNRLDVPFIFQIENAVNDVLATTRLCDPDAPRIDDGGPSEKILSLIMPELVGGHDIDRV